MIEGTGPARSRDKVQPTWTFIGEAVQSADDVYYQKLPAISVEAFSVGVLAQQGEANPLPHREQREIYADSLFDLSRLLEEIRFEVALAVMLLVDFRVHRDRAKWKLRMRPTPTWTCLCRSWLC
jgi:hypothetical protein